MATNIPPHNLVEIVSGLEALIADPEISIEDLMKYIPGPDFPTAGVIMGTEGIKQAYYTGRGSVRIRARYTIEERKNGRNAIIVTEIPYQVNKSRLVEKIAELARDKKIDGIVDLRDESNRNGMRIVIEIRRDVNVNVVVNRLFRHTQMEAVWHNHAGVGQWAAAGFELRKCCVYRAPQDVITRRTRYELKIARTACI